MRLITLHPCYRLIALKRSRASQRFACRRRRLPACTLTLFYSALSASLRVHSFWAAGSSNLRSFLCTHLFARRRSVVLRPFVSQHSDTHFTVLYCATLSPTLFELSPDFRNGSWQETFVDLCSDESILHCKRCSHHRHIHYLESRRHQWSKYNPLHLLCCWLLAVGPIEQHIIFLMTPTTFGLAAGIVTLIAGLSSLPRIPAFP